MLKLTLHYCQDHVIITWMLHLKIKNENKKISQKWLVKAI